MRQYVVDAFTDKLFGGNPAAICVMDSWLTDELMLAIARENNLSETAFTVKEGEKYRLRWFTPGGEIDLCGHATLACAFVLMTEIDKSLTAVTFTTMSGELTVKKNGELFEMDFPAYSLEKAAVTEAMCEAIGFRPLEAYMGRDLLCVLENEEQVRAAAPDMEKLKTLDGLLLHITAAGKTHDCVSRSFAPKLSVNEDPVCGSGHCHIAPYWAEKTGRNDIVAYQASRRGGTLWCRMRGDRLTLSGKAVIYSAAELNI